MEQQDYNKRTEKNEHKCFQKISSQDISSAIHDTQRSMPVWDQSEKSPNEEKEKRFLFSSITGKYNKLTKARSNVSLIESHIDQIVL